MEKYKKTGIRVIACKNPFDFSREESFIAAGKTLAEIVESVSPHKDFAPYAHVTVGGEQVPKEKWASVRPKAGTVVTVRFVPGKGGGLMSIMTLAVAIAAPEIGGMMAAEMGGWVGNLFVGASMLGHIFGAVVGIIGTLALHALAPPPKQRNAISGSTSPATNPTLFIQGAQNQTLPWGTVPYPLGKSRMVPPMGARAYTETVGNDQYVRMLFVWGYGPLEITDLKIGETDISQFSDVEIETRQGYSSDTPISLYSDTVIQTDLQVLLSSVDGFQQRTSEMDADEISVDLTFLNGLAKFNNDGTKSNVTVQVTVGYSVTGANVWTDQTYTYTANQTNAIRESVRIKVATGQYDVRVKRVTADATDSTVYDKVTWTAIRTLRYTQPVTMTGIAMTALRIKATDQLNGVINNFNGVVQSVLADWNGTDWTTVQATSNPASIFRAVLQGPGNARPLADSRINLSALQTWHDDCAAAGYEYNAVIAGNSLSVSDVLAEVAATGRASPALIDGKWQVVEDVEKTVPVQHFTPRNSFGYAGQLAYVDQPHALRVQFTNQDNGWNPDEIIVYDDGYSKDGTTPGTVAATKFETLQLTGITSSDQAWKAGRYHIATARLRPELYMFSVDVEHLVCTRGDLIKFTHDVPMFGIQAGRVKSRTLSGANIVSVTLDTTVPMVSGTNYGIRFRLSDGTSLQMNVDTVAGNTDTLTLATPYDSATGPQVGDLAMFGEASSETVDLIVKSVEPAKDLTAKLTCVDYAPAVFTADTGTIPPFNSQITVPVEFTQPPTPVVSSVQADDTVMIINAAGSYQPVIVVTLAPPAYPVPLQPIVKIQSIDETIMHPATFTASGNRIAITGVESGGIYNISIVYQNTTGIYSAAALINSQLVTAGTVAPDDVTNFNINILNDTAYLSWDQVTSVTLQYYRIKYNPATTGATWENSFLLVDKISGTHTSAAVPALPGTYLIKAVNVFGLESAAETDIVSTITAVHGQTSVLTLAEDPAFGGPSVNCTVSGGTLQLTDTSLGSGEYYFDISSYMDDWEDVDLVDNWDTYVEETQDFGAVYTVRVTASMTVSGVDISTTVDTWANVDTVTDWDQSAPSSLWGAQLQIRTTQTDPTASPTWSAWQNFVVGDYTARALQFRIVLYSYSSNITPSITALSVALTMPNRTEAAADLAANAADAGGTAVTFASSFKAAPAIQISGQSMATGDYWSLSNKSASGFDISFYDSTGTRISRTFDYAATGYGQGG